MDLLQLKQRADDAYYNSSSPIMGDEEYDKLCDTLQFDFTVGSVPRPRDRVQLPTWMGSLTKCTTSEQIELFLRRNMCDEFTVQEKLDGVSCLYVNDNGAVSLFTRGDGTVGTDITRLVTQGLKLYKEEYTLSKKYPSFMVRGELVLSKQKFEKKYKDSFANARNMVSGQINRKETDVDVMCDVDFVAYELIEPPENSTAKPSRDTPQRQSVWQYQLCFLKKYFKVVFNRVLNKKYIDEDVLLDYLERRRQRSEYQIDGLVVTANCAYVRNDSGNPKYAFAFKSKANTVAETVVGRVEWNLSKGGKYKPRIFVAPTQLAGVTISCLTGFNARYIVDNSIGEGSRLLITRSGDVIPHIVAVLSPGRCELPSRSEWRSVDLCHTFEESPKEVEIKKMVYFLSSIKVKNCKERTVSKLYDHGIRSIEDLLNADGICPKLCQETRDRIAEASVHELLAALNAFGEGIGLKKIEVLKFTDKGDLHSEHVKGISVNTVREKILPYLGKGLERVRNLKRFGGNFAGVSARSALPSALFDARLSGQVFVFTGFRDKGLEKEIKRRGGDVRSAVSAKTTAVVVDQCSKVGAKWAKANELGIPVVTKSEVVKLIN